MSLETIESMKAEMHEKAEAGGDAGTAALELVDALVENRHRGEAGYMGKNHDQGQIEVPTVAAHVTVSPCLVQAQICCMCSHGACQSWCMCNTTFHDTCCSATFASKTKFSQEKFLKQKQRRHAPLVSWGVVW